MQKYDISKQRNFYRKRRNKIRMFLLFFVTVFFASLFFVIYSLPKNKALKIEVVNNSLISNPVLIAKTFELTNGENFFLLSPRNLSSKLLQSFPILNGLVVRKYLFPDYKLILYVKEKSIWGKLNEDKSQRDIYLADDGAIILKDYLDNSKLPSPLINVFVTKIPSTKTLFELKKTTSFLNQQMYLMLNKAILFNEDDLEFVTDSGVKIKAGKIDDGLADRLLKLAQVLKTIKQKNLAIEYLDLTLENGVILKKYPLKDIDKKERLKKQDLFNWLRH